MRLARVVPAAVAGYLVGTFPSADLAARLATGGDVDLRSAGSGNPGAANAMKVLGRRYGYAVMAADITKGALAAQLGRAIAGPLGSHVAGTAAVVGHCYPVWSRFRGGKGVAASVGQCLATFPVYLPIDLTVASVASLPSWRSRAAAATTVASAGWVLGGVLWWRKRLPNLWGPPPSAALPLAAAASSAVILTRFATARPPAPATSPATPPAQEEVVA